MPLRTEGPGCYLEARTAGLAGRLGRISWFGKWREACGSEVGTLVLMVDEALVVLALVDVVCRLHLVSLWHFFLSARVC